MTQVYTPLKSYRRKIGEYILMKYGFPDKGGHSEQRDCPDLQHKCCPKLTLRFHIKKPPAEEVLAEGKFPSV